MSRCSGKILLIKYVLKACISRRDATRLASNYATVNELVVYIKKHFVPKQSSAILSAKLQGTRQGDLGIEEYGRSIEPLMSDLTLAQAEDDNTALEIFKKENEKLAVDVFVRGIRNTELRTVIKASHFKTLNDAINSAKDEVLIMQQNASICAFSTMPKQNFKTHNKFRGNFTNNRGNNRHFNISSSSTR